MYHSSRSRLNWSLISPGYPLLSFIAGIATIFSLHHWRILTGGSHIAESFLCQMSLRCG
jgi:hypothetical protein